MPDTPVFFSIVIPLYNKEATIARAIQSVLNQTVQDFEIVIVNDGSTDKGPDIVSAIKDSRIRLIHQEIRAFPPHATKALQKPNMI